MFHSESKNNGRDIFSSVFCSNTKNKLQDILKQLYFDMKVIYNKIKGEKHEKNNIKNNNCYNNNFGDYNMHK